MSFTSRYQNGETASVYRDVYQLGEDAFKKEYFADISNLLDLTFQRVAKNLSVIYGELKNIGYRFIEDREYSFQTPLLPPDKRVSGRLKKLDARVKPFGYVPESLKSFYRNIGGCNFAWDNQNFRDSWWKGADPLQITPLDDILMELNEMIDDEDQIEIIELSADYLHKDNISGGSAYGIAITATPSIDAEFDTGDSKTTFIDYLRLSMDGCGFSRASSIADPRFVQFQKQVKPRLLPI